MYSSEVGTVQRIKDPLPVGEVTLRVFKDLDG